MLFTVEAQSDDVKVAAVVTPRHIQLNEKATLELTISGKTQIKYIGTPKFDFLPDFLAVPLQTKTTPRLIDDKVAVTMAWAYELIPQKIGEIVLSDISFTYQGIPYVTNPGKIIVGAVDTYHHTSTGGIHKVEAEVSNQNPYLNEVIEYRFRYLYTTVLPTMDTPTSSLPDFSGFVVETQSDKKNFTVKIHGTTFQVQEHVKRLYPQSIGKILIQPSQLQLPIQGNPKNLKTKPIPLNVQPLPDLGKPTYFDGAVGVYNITAQVDRSRLEVRKALTLSLQITGTGNFSTVSPPLISSINGFRVNPKTQVKSNTTNSSNFFYVVIPLKIGILQIPAIKFAYFNPIKKAYQTTETTPIPITVLPNPVDVVDLESNSISWLLWLLLIPLLACVAVGAYLLYKTNNGTIPPHTGTTPAGQAYAALQELDSGKTDVITTSMGEKMNRILSQYLCELQGVSYRQLNTSDVQEICQHLGLSLPIKNEINDIFTKCDYHRFAPVSLSADGRHTLITRTEVVIKHIDEAISFT